MEFLIGTLFELPCVPPTVFNPDVGICDWTYNVADCYFSFT